MSVAVVTDSTAYLPPDVVARYGIEVVPLYVVLAGRSGREGLRHQPRRRGPRPVGARAVTCRRPGRRPGTSSPPTAGAWTRGANGSSRSTCPPSCRARGTPPAWPPPRSASTSSGWSTPGRRPWARASPCWPPPVRPPPARGSTTVVEAARRTAAATRTFFVVETLEHLRRGGRIGPAAALLGIGARGQAGAARARRHRRAAGEGAHLCPGARAGSCSGPSEAAGAAPSPWPCTTSPRRSAPSASPAELRQRLPRHAELHVSELGAAIGAHVGPGSVGVVVLPQPEEPTPEDDRRADRRADRGVAWRQAAPRR